MRALASCCKVNNLPDILPLPPGWVGGCSCCSMAWLPTDTMPELWVTPQSHCDGCSRVATCPLPAIKAGRIGNQTEAWANMPGKQGAVWGTGSREGNRSSRGGPRARHMTGYRTECSAAPKGGREQLLRRHGSERCCAAGS